MTVSFYYYDSNIGNKDAYEEEWLYDFVAVYEYMVTPVDHLIAARTFALFVYVSI